MTDRRTRDLARAARGGDYSAGVQLAYALQRSGALPSSESDWWYSGRSHSSLVPVPSYTVSVSEGGPDVCLVPASPTAIFVMVGPALEPHQTTGLLEASGPMSLKDVGYHGSNRFVLPFAPCSPMRGVVYRTRTKEYELSTTGTFNLGERGGKPYWEGAKQLNWHFRGAQRRPAGHEDISRDTKLRMIRPMARLVNDWAADHPEALNLPERGVSVTNLSRTLNRLAKAQREVAEIESMVSDAAIRAAAQLGF